MTPIDKVRLSVDAILVGGTATAGYYAITGASKIEEKDKEIVNLKQEKEQLMVDAGIEVNKLNEKNAKQEKELEQHREEGQRHEIEKGKWQNELAQCKNNIGIETLIPES